MPTALEVLKIYVRLHPSYILQDMQVSWLLRKFGTGIQPSFYPLAPQTSDLKYFLIKNEQKKSNKNKIISVLAAKRQQISESEHLLEQRSDKYNLLSGGEDTTLNTMYILGETEK